MSGVDLSDYNFGCPMISGYPFGTPVTGSGISPKFRLDPSDLNRLSIGFSPDAVGSVTVERTTDGGVTWAPIKSGSQVLSTLSKTGNIEIIDWSLTARYRLNWNLSAGSFTGGPSFDQYDPRLGPTGATLSRTGSSGVFPDKPGGILFGVSVYPGTSPAITSWTASIMRSTDNGSTWTALQTGSSPFSLAVVPGGTPALYRVDVTMTPASVTNGGIIVNAQPQGVYDALFPRVGLNAGRSYDDALSVASWTPLPDETLAGNLTLYKVCAGNTFAKVTVPAAARRLKGRLFARGGWRDIRAEYVDVVSVVDAGGNALPQAASQTDASTIYKAGARTTFRDPTGGTWLGDFTCTGFPLGLYGYPTLIEAVQGPSVDRSMTNGSYNLPQPNLAAIAAALG